MQIHLHEAEECFHLNVALWGFILHLKNIAHSHGFVTEFKQDFFFFFMNWLHFDALIRK